MSSHLSLNVDYLMKEITHTTTTRKAADWISEILPLIFLKCQCDLYDAENQSQHDISGAICSSNKCQQNPYKCSPYILYDNRKSWLNRQEIQKNPLRIFATDIDIEIDEEKLPLIVCKNSGSKKFSRSSSIVHKSRSMRISAKLIEKMPTLKVKIQDNFHEIFALTESGHKFVTIGVV